jgi:hypothetical protein
VKLGNEGCRCLRDAVFFEIDEVEVGFDFLFGGGADGAALIEGGLLFGRVGLAIDELVVEVGDGVIAGPGGSEVFLEGVEDAFIGRVLVHELLKNGAFHAEEIEEGLVETESEVVVAGKLACGEKAGLVDHAREMMETAELLVRAAGRDFRRGGNGQAQFLPAAETAIDGDHVGVAHLLEIIGRERGAVAAAAISDNAGLGIRNALFDVALDDAFAEMDGARGVTGVPFAFFADIDEINAGFLGLDVGIVDGDFFIAIFGVIDQFKELRAVQHGEELHWRRFAQVQVRV